MALELRIAENERDAVLVFRAYKAMHDEGLAPGSFSAAKVLGNIFRMMKGQGSVVLMAMDGDNLAGVISLYEQGYWYSEQDRHLIDKGLYAYPEHRDGETLDLLLDAARQTADDLGIPCFIFNLTFNAARKRRAPRNGWERTGTILAHFPPET